MNAWNGTVDGELITLQGMHAAEIMNYVTGVIDGTIIAGEDRILGCRRFVDFIKRAAMKDGDIKDGEITMDINPTDADFVISIIERTYAHRQGESLNAEPMRGKPFLLEPWEKLCVYGMLIFYHRGTKERLTKEAFIFIPRKNSKTLFASALAWALAILQRASGSVVYVVAASLKQDMENFNLFV